MGKKTKSLKSILYTLKQLFLIQQQATLLLYPRIRMKSARNALKEQNNAQHSPH